MSIYQPLSPERSDVLRSKRIYGIWFGAALGFTFALFAWGVDAFLLSTMNSLHPWIKFVGGTVPSIIVGALAGWLSARIDKAIIAVLIWAVASLAFAWLTVMLPLQIAPRLLGAIEPEVQSLLHYTYYAGFSARVGVAYVWIVIFVSIAGLLQLPLSDGAVFSTSWLGKLAPMLVGLVLMSISGTIIDGLNNELLRSPIDSLNLTIQFMVDHQGQEIDVLESRRMHLGSLRAVETLITPQRRLIVSSYDEYLNEVNVLVKFERAWVECKVFYNQPINCKQVGNVP
ncbi:MAG: hypothetical protein ABI621_05755 [Chloroflexota bacterium]